MKQVLIETQYFTAKPLKLVEGTVPTSNPLVEGILATCEVKNGNGRYYSRDLWEREIKKYMESVNANRALGELDHPDSSIINLKLNASLLSKLIKITPSLLSKSLANNRRGYINANQPL